MRLFLVECPIESCYVCGGFHLNFLAKKAPGGRSLDMIIYSGSFGRVWEEKPEMVQFHCSRLLDRLKNFYILCGGIISKW